MKKKISKCEGICIDIPGYGTIKLKYLVLDLNGTIMQKGIIKDSTVELINRLSQKLKIFVLTADTYGAAKNICRHLKTELMIIEKGQEKEAKADFVKKLGSFETAAIGNGNNDEFLLEQARLGIIVLGEEGCSTKALSRADIMVKDIDHALDMFLNTDTLKAVLRS